jgi:hypothetical protein
MQLKDELNKIHKLCNPSGLHRSVAGAFAHRMHSLRNASNNGISFLPSDASLTGCQRYLGIS